MIRIGLVVLAMLLAAAGGTAQAQDLSAPHDLVVKWVTAKGELLNERTLDLAALDGFPQVRIVTSTPWTHGPQTFTGPALATLARLTDKAPKEVAATALNDYSAVIPAADWLARGVIVATRLNGETMRVRDKGPYWIMYPIDGSEEFESARYQSRMVWQVKELDFLVQ